ncbi:MAG: hypothetical protein RLZZ89_899 [Cyanobacteriota bacterium]|jgi:HEPN domain-containing protein
MSPTEDALLLMRLVERHLGSLRSSLEQTTFADEDWGFLAQQTLEKLLKAFLVYRSKEPPRSHSLQRLVQELVECDEVLLLAPELLELDDFAVLARYDSEPTPLPTDRSQILLLLEALYEKLRQRLS